MYSRDEVEYLEGSQKIGIDTGIVGECIMRLKRGFFWKMYTRGNYGYIWVDHKWTYIYGEGRRGNTVSDQNHGSTVAVETVISIDLENREIKVVIWEEPGSERRAM